MEERTKHAKECMDQGCLLYAEKQLEKAEARLKEALSYYEAARKNKKHFKLEIAALYKLLGDIYEIKGNRKKANLYYEISHSELES